MFNTLTEQNQDCLCQTVQLRHATATTTMSDCRCLSPVTGALHHELFAAAGDDAAPNPGLGSGTGPGLCQAERKRLDCTKPTAREQGWRDNVHTAYLPKEQRRRNLRMEGQEKSRERKREVKVPTVCWSGVVCWS